MFPRTLLLLPLLATSATAQIFPDSTLGRMTFHSSLFNRIPVRNLRDLQSFAPFMSAEAGKNYAFGSEWWDRSWTLDGFSLIDPHSGEPIFEPILEGLASVSFVASNYDAAASDAAATSMSMTLPRGGDTWTFNALGSMDGFSSAGEQFLGTTIQGEQRVLGLLSGPLLPDLKLFVAAQHYSTSNRQPLFLSPFSLGGIPTDMLGPRGPAPDVLPGVIDVRENFLQNNGLTSTTLQGNVSWEPGPASFSLVFAASSSEHPLGNDWPDVLQNALRRDRALVRKQSSELIGLRASMHIEGFSTISASAAYSANRHHTSDPIFGDNWRSFVDSAAAAQHGLTGYTAFYAPPLPYSIINQFLIEHPHAPNNSYRRDQTTGWEFELKAASDPVSDVRLSAGIRHQIHTVRSFRILDIRSYNAFLNGIDGRSPRTFSSEVIRRSQIRSAGEIASYGFDYEGNLVDSGPDAPRQPTTTTGFVQATLTRERLNATLGAHVTSFQTDVSADARRTTLFLPRANAAWQVLPWLSFDMGAGMHANMTPLEYIIPVATTFGQRPNGYLDFPAYRMPVRNVEPSRSSMVETGLRASWSWLTARAGAYYRSESDRFLQSLYEPTFSISQIVVRQMKGSYDEIGWHATIDAEVVSVAGVRLIYAGRSTSDLIDAISDAGMFRGLPRNLQPYVRTQQLKGLVMFHSAGLDRMDEPGFFATMAGSYTGGLNYQPIQQPSNLGSLTAWNIGVASLLGSQTSVANGPETSTPWLLQFDLRAGWKFDVGAARLELFVNVMNLLNNKQVLRVYPHTGSDKSDGWLESPFAAAYRQLPLYEAFYGTINSLNRWAFMKATGADIYGEPRQIQVGMRVWFLTGDKE